MYRLQEHRIKGSHSKKATSPVVIRPICGQAVAAKGIRRPKEERGREGEMQRGRLGTD